MIGILFAAALAHAHPHHHRPPPLPPCGPQRVLNCTLDGTLTDSAVLNSAWPAPVRIMPYCEGGYDALGACLSGPKSPPQSTECISLLDMRNLNQYRDEVSRHAKFEIDEAAEAHKRIDALKAAGVGLGVDGIMIDFYDAQGRDELARADAMTGAILVLAKKQLVCP